MRSFLAFVVRLREPLNCSGHEGPASKMVGRPGFEPGTNNLKGCCSTVELSTQKLERWLLGGQSSAPQAETGKCANESILPPASQLAESRGGSPCLKRRRSVEGRNRLGETGLRPLAGDAPGDAARGAVVRQAGDSVSDSAASCIDPAQRSRRGGEHGENVRVAGRRSRSAWRVAIRDSKIR